LGRSAALNATGRPILFSLCNWGDDDVLSWGAQVSRGLCDLTLSPPRLFAVRPDVPHSNGPLAVVCSTAEHSQVQAQLLKPYVLVLTGGTVARLPDKALAKVAQSVTHSLFVG
jgi:hypothetical protein